MGGKKTKTTKKKIVSAAWRLFYEQGYDNTTVDDIVEESGTSKGSFYHYFDGKDALLSSLSILFDEKYEDSNDRYWLWRFMIDENLQGNGYGTAALQVIIKYFREHGANNIRLSTKETNTTALSMYRKAGFRDTGEMNDEEIVLQLNL